MLRVTGGNLGAGGGQILFASSGQIKEGSTEIGNGNIIVLNPPEIEVDPIHYLSFRKPKEEIIRTRVLTRPENLTGYWPMDEEQGFLLYDQYGQKHANLGGKFERVTGKIGSAIEFDGKTGFARTDASAKEFGIDGKKPRTISFWISLATYQPNEQAGPYGYGEIAQYDGTDRYWSIRNIAHDNFSSLISDHYSWNFVVNHGGELRDTWNHLAHTYDGSKISVYLNGQPVASEIRSTISTGNIVPLTMGRANEDTNTFFYGKLDDFRVYNDVLSDSEIATISTASDLLTETVNLQLQVGVEGNVDQISVDGLPNGLEMDSQSYEIIGLPQQTGTFDLNITATNRAGVRKESIRLIVLKSEPEIESSKAKNISSSNAQAIAQIISDGGEPLQMTLFWGDNDGGENPGLWDQNYTIDGLHTDGRISHYISSLSGDRTYYYRWMGTNSVIDQVWSKPTTDGLIHWWTFDEISGNQVMDSIGHIPGNMDGLSAGSRTFAFNELGLPFSGQENEKLIMKDYKGIYGNQARTVSLWIQTLDQSAKIIDWGAVKTAPRGLLGLIRASPFYRLMAKLD